MPRNLKELAQLIARRDGISLNEAIIIVEECGRELQSITSITEAEDVMMDYLGLELDYLDLFLM